MRCEGQRGLLVGVSACHPIASHAPGIDQQIGDLAVRCVQRHR